MNHSPVVVELFAGAGGAALGIRAAMPGAHHTLVDLDPSACAVLRAADLGDVVEGDVRTCLAALPTEPELLWASPPCQPHSRAGRRLGSDDPRDCWPATMGAIRLLRPRMIVVENVLGAPVEDWRRQVEDLGYVAAVWTLDAADYGVPQRRRRHFLVGVRGGLGADLCPPHPTHSAIALARAKWATGDYWAEHGMDGPPPSAMPTKAEERALRCLPDGLARWRTIRDVLDLAAWAPSTNLRGGPVAPRAPDEPSHAPVASGHATGGLYGWVRTEPTVPTVGNQYAHQINPGARTYNKHPSMDADAPALTVKAGGGGRTDLAVGTTWSESWVVGTTHPLDYPNSVPSATSPTSPARRSPWLGETPSRPSNRGGPTCRAQP